MLSIDPLMLLTISLTFMLAGMVKGITGMGLPTVTLAILTVVLDLPTAMGLLLIPSFCTNLWQAFSGGAVGIVVRRCWAFLLPATLLVPLGGMSLLFIDTSLLSSLLGAVLISYAAVSLLGLKLIIDENKQRWAGPLCGAVNGMLTGMTGSFAVPGVMYLQGIGFNRTQLIQAMGILFTLSTLALGVSLNGNELLSERQMMLSALGLIPAIAGMLIGQRIRSHLSEQLFRKVFFTALLLLGGYILLSVI
ncbi:MAG: sulfite exporter TauE/SafE family protein [Amphritea sp.]|nr:sulfite exporter TauE/SafE family protein [Amphritea sp.]